MFRKIFTIVLLCIAMKLNSQITGGFRYADSLSYSLYTQERWDDLIRAGSNFVKEGYDYYYMRMRIGIAYYERHNYAMAAIQFRNAQMFNENDQVALEYLFYSYYLSGRTNQSRTLLSSFYPQNRERILKESRIKKNNLTIESFYCDARTDNILSDPEFYFSEPVAGCQIVTNYFSYNSLYASHSVGNNFSYFHAYTLIIKDNYLHYFDGLYTAHLFPQRVVQNQYYGSFNFYSSTGWNFSPSFHLLTTGYPLISISTSGMNPSATAYIERSFDYYLGLSVTKSFGFVVISAESGYSDLNSTEVLQGTVSLMVYPAGNSSIYFGGKISTGTELRRTSSNIKVFGGFTAGFSIADKVRFEFSGLSGDMKNSAESNGLYIYNSTDILKNKFTGRIIIPFNKTGLAIYAGGGISSYSSEFIPMEGILNNGSNKLNYKSINFIGGISWNY